MERTCKFPKTQPKAMKSDLMTTGLSAHWSREVWSFSEFRSDCRQPRPVQIRFFLRDEESLLAAGETAGPSTHNSNLCHPSPLVIPAEAKRSGGICGAPCGSLKSFPAMLGRGIRLANKINPTESNQQLIWTALSPTRTLHPFWGNFRVGGNPPCAGINRHVVEVQVPAGKEVANPS
jgi:hypothetical protein